MARTTLTKEDLRTLFQASRSRYTAEDGQQWQVLARQEMRQNGIEKDEIGALMRLGYLVEFRAYDKKGTAHVLYALAGEPLNKPKVISTESVQNDQDPNPQTPSVQP